LKKIYNKINNINQNIINNNFQNFGKNNINLNNINQININMNKNDKSHSNQNFNNKNINNNFNQNNNANLMGNNIIIKYLENNKFLINQILNFILQNNNEQMKNYLQPIIICLIQIDNNMNYIMNLINKNYCQINNNFDINNNIFDNKDNKNKINNYKNIEDKNNINDNFLFKEYEDYFPLIGLKNTGSLSYMNSILQCLFHIPELNGFFINKYPDQKDKLKKINKFSDINGRLCEEFYKIVIDIYKAQKGNCISPKDFNNFISQINDQLDEVNERDFLSFLFQMMHTELNYLGDQKLKNLPKCNQSIEKDSFNYFMTVTNNLNLSIISYLFYGILKSKTICKGCNYIFFNFQYFQFLNFPTFFYKNKNFNIYQGFIDFFKPNLISGENKCYCQKCKGLRDMEITNKIYYPPPYLIINIDYGESKKYIPKEVSFGGIIDIIDFIDDSNKSPSIQYKLIAVCNYIGKSGSIGSYITYCPNNQDKWYEFNDSRVSETQFENVNSYSPRILIYKKI